MSAKDVRITAHDSLPIPPVPEKVPYLALETLVIAVDLLRHDIRHVAASHWPLEGSAIY
jgi:hypothetical protein